MLQSPTPKMPRQNDDAVAPEINQKVFILQIMGHPKKWKTKIKMSFEMGNAPTPLTLLEKSTPSKNGNIEVQQLFL